MTGGRVMQFPPLRRRRPRAQPEPAAKAVVDHAGARWAAADAANYQPAARPAEPPINYVVLRLTDGTYADAIAAAKNPAACCSSHYVIRLSDGEITQTVRERDIALYPARPEVVQRSISVAHERPRPAGAPLSGESLQASAALVRAICVRYRLAPDRGHILGYDEVAPGRGEDFRRHWDWAAYLALVQAGAGIIVDNSSPGRFWAGGGWRTSNWNQLHFGPDYRLSTPAAQRDAAWYRVPFPVTGRYAVDAWYPAAEEYNASTPVTLFTSGGPLPMRLNQRAEGGRWVHLGVFPFQQGDHWAVAVSRMTESAGYIVADAFRFTPAGG